MSTHEEREKKLAELRKLLPLRYRLLSDILTVYMRGGKILEKILFPQRQHLS